MTAIRTASTADAPAVAHLMRACGADRPGPGAPVRARLAPWEERLADPATTALAAEDAGRLAGFACAVPLEEGRVEVAVVVHPDARGHGLGKVLLQRVVSSVADAGYDEAELWAADDEPARRLCARAGWRAAGRESALVRHEAALVELLGALPRDMPRPRPRPAV